MVGQKKLRLYLKLFVSMLTLSAMTFGGGYVIVPLMKKRFADKDGWFQEEEMLELVAIAQSCPGAISINAATLVGYRMAGFFGAVISAAGTVLPPLIILSLLSLAYSRIRGNAYVGAAFRGMQAGIAAVIADVVVTMAAPFLKREKIFGLSIMLLAFVAAWFLKINAAIIILVCAVAGAAAQLVLKPKGGGTS